MLRELRIRDVAIIEDLEVQFGSGLNVLSGETGAGKSIILGALGLVLGARSSGDLVRTGAESAEVQARVDLSPAVGAVLQGLDIQSPDEDEGILLRRIVHSLFNWDLDLNDGRAAAPAPAAASRGPAEGVTPQREHAD